MIGGNLTATIQIKGLGALNEIGERETSWEDIHSIQGFLDYSSGQTNHTNFNAKIQETTHIFICDYFTLDSRVTSENSRMIINGKKYEVLMIDNPMELNKHLEIYLKYVGGQ